MQEVVSCTGAEAELGALVEGICEGIWFTTSELGIMRNRCISLYSDNKPADQLTILSSLVELNTLI